MDRDFKACKMWEENKKKTMSPFNSAREQQHIRSLINQKLIWFPSVLSVMENAVMLECFFQSFAVSKRG